MSANDRLYLILEPAPDAGGAVPFQALTDLVLQIENLVTDALRGIIAKTGRRSGLSDAPPVPLVTARLAGNPQRGSIIVPLDFVVGNAAAVMAWMQATSTNAHLPQYVSTLADIVDLVRFARDVVFGARGYLARRWGQGSNGDTPAEQAEMMLARDISWSTDVIAVMEAAARTGCSRVEVCVNDGPRLSLMRGELLLSKNALARPGKPRRPVPGIERIDERTVLVEFEGEKLPAFRSTVPGDIDSDVIVVWKSRQAIPEFPVQMPRVQARWIDREELEIVEEIPSDWHRCKGIVLVEAVEQSQWL